MIRTKCLAANHPSWSFQIANSVVCGPPLRAVLAWILRRGASVLNFMRSFPDKRRRVLFINSALLGGADTWIHFLLLRNLSQDQFELHAAGQPGSPAPAFDTLRSIP